jgi:hypothetical protein
MTDPSGGPLGDRVDLYWIPLGAGDRVVQTSGRVYEALCAWRERRPRRALYHSALVLSAGGERVTIEMTPVPGAGTGSDRGVVAEGSVGTRWAGRLRVFRYEIRRWRDGVIPDLPHAVGSPVRVSGEPAVVRSVLELAPLVPTPVWGRDELGAGDMWNSNSVVAWLLARAGVDGAAGGPPGGGRAPGWTAGLVQAHRDRAEATIGAR